MGTITISDGTQIFYYWAVAYDRRGHGRSSQPWDGNDLGTYADDLRPAPGHP